MDHLPARLGLMFGNFVVGIAILAPAGMLGELSEGLDITIQEAGLLVTYGAVVLCFGSPIMAWLTSRIDRKILLGATLAVVSLGQFVTALAPDYFMVLAIRLVALAFAAIYTPQAASTVALMVSEKDRAGAIAFVFLGWSMAFAAGLPAVTFLASALGWRGAFLALAVAGLVSAALLLLTLPRGLQGRPLTIKSFGEVAAHRTLLLLLLVSLLSTAGQLTIFVYMAPLLATLIEDGARLPAMFFALFGAASLIGNVVGTRLVLPLGTRKTFALSLGFVIAGISIWAFGGGSAAIMAIGVGIWGLGFASGNSMQQARLNAAAPDLAGVSIAFNTSLIYVGQAIGSGLGGWLFVRGQFGAIGYAALALTVCAGVILVVGNKRNAEI